MGKENAGVRDGTGSFKGSWQDENREVGKRQEAGEICPVNDNDEETEEPNALKEKEVWKPEENTICRHI